ncbi:COX19 [Symbiodinium natans]|uniref:COX19 protein n=1 Tax=Symbiodinium natans TaxID=878477 RepID=A0A812JAR7_9DINO|nr:COX19 [Symbiodinium natans]
MGKRIMPGRPPDKGSFPLDHFSECSKLKDEYLQCLKQHSHDNMSCRYLSKQYLQCRMDKNLMTKEPMHRLGFTEEEVSPAPARKKDKKKTKEEIERTCSPFPIFFADSEPEPRASLGYATPNGADDVTASQVDFEICSCDA